MGGFVSTPVLNNIETPNVLNFILQEMFRRSDLVDIYSLADSKRCSRYIVASADALQKLFVKIRVNPVKGSNGILYFQSMDGLLGGMPADLKAQQRANCLELSFFFIRIFQIFGAVAISMFDNTIPSVDPLISAPPTPRPGIQKVFLQQKDFNSLGVSTQTKPSSSSWFGFGGALSASDRSFYIPDGSYKILNFHLYRPEGGSASTSPMKFEGFDIYIDQNTLYDIVVSNGQVTDRKIKSNPQPILKYGYSRNSTQYVITATLKIDGIDEYIVSLSNFAKDGTSVKVYVSQEVLRTFAGDKPASLGQGYPNVKGKTLPTILQAMFNDATNKIFGPVPYSTLKFLRKMNYISGGVDTDNAISGTHINILGSQENSDNPRIIFRDSMQIPTLDKDQSKKINVIIRANLQVDEPIQDVTDGSYQYKVTIDFSKSQIDPPDVRDYVDTLSSYKTSTFVAYSKDSAPKSERTNLSIPAYLESVFQKIIKPSGSRDENGGIRTTRDGLPKPYNSESIPNDLRIKELWTALAKDPPIKSYCIARAVQLLSVDAIRGNMSKPAYSSACALSFVYQKDGSLPAPEKKITDVNGLHALATLFWTDFETTMPKLQDEAKYKNFLKFMKMNLENKTAEDTTQPDKMSGIIEKLGPVCDNRQGARLELRSDVTSKLQLVVKSLIQQQRDHIAAGMQILQELFDMKSIQNKKVFAINPEVLRSGMPEVNRIAGLARGILMKYYSGCESTYRDGLKILYQSDLQKPLTALKADGTQIVIPTTTIAPPSKLTNSTNSLNSSVT